MSEISNENLVNKENKMGVDRVSTLILVMSIPSMFSMLIQALYNIVDSIFVAQYSSEALSAVSLAFPMQTLLIAVGMGTGVGVNSLISRLLGAKEQKKADSTANHGLIISFVFGIIFAIVGILFSRTYMEMFTTNQVVIDMGVQYLVINLVCSIGLMICGIGPKILQATGDMITPMTTQILGAVINIILDPILIFGLFGFPRLGVAGAAIATVTGQIISGIYILYVLYKKEHHVKVDLLKFKYDPQIVKSIFIVGFPAIAMQAMASLLITGLNKILAIFSLDAVNVLGIYYKLQSFIFMPIFGLTQGAMPVMGYNYGAKKMDRVYKALKVSFIIAIGIMAVGTFIFFVFPEVLLGMFNATDSMIEIGVGAFRKISVGFIFAAIGIMSSVFFQALGQGYKSFVISLLRQLIILLPAAYILGTFLGLDYFWYAFFISEIISVAISVIWLRSTIKKLNNEVDLI